MSDIILNEDQQVILDKLKEFIEKSRNNYCLFEGCAGVGKTTVITKLIEYYNANAMFHNIVMAAPTWKAVKVIREMMPELIRKDIAFTSVHSLLGLKYKITKEGKEVFERDRKSISKLMLFDLVIIDEASMLADQLFLELESQNYKNVKIIFVGDSNQINPVNHMHSIPMLEHQRKSYNIEHLQLSKIVRQAENNPIIKYSQDVLKDKFTFVGGLKEVQDDSGVVMIDSSQQTAIHQLIEYYFCSEKFDKNANYCKLGAWRNVVVDSFNKEIRNMKYGAKSPKIVLNEKLIVEKPIKDASDEPLFTTNEDLVVLDIQEYKKIVYDQEYICYSCLVKGDIKEERIDILHESCEKMYKKKLAELYKDASVFTGNNGVRIDKWKRYFGFQENFAHVKYNYALTIHNMQGSTYDNAFIVYSDIIVNRNEEEQKRILYTAITRPRNMLYIL